MINIPGSLRNVSIEISIDDNVYTITGLKKFIDMAGGNTAVIFTGTLKELARELVGLKLQNKTTYPFNIAIQENKIIFCGLSYSIDTTHMPGTNSFFLDLADEVSNLSYLLAFK